MAYMIPDNVREDAPFWERKLFNRFRAELSDEVIVLHSLGIARHLNKRWGECDFVLITPEGIFFLEVKGGGVHCHEGKWTYTSLDGSSYTKHESPWEQASSAMFSIRDDLRVAHPGFENYLYGFGVIMPDEVFLMAGPELEQEYLLDRREWHRSLDRYVERLINVWEHRYKEKWKRTPGRLSRRQREEIRRALRPDSVSVYTLWSKLNNAERQLVDLTSEQIRAFQGMEDNKHVLVEGGAGTGKTMLAFEQAKRLAGKGLNVLMLCYTRLLASHLKSNVQSLENTGGKICVSSIHSFFKDMIIEAGFKDHLDELSRNTAEDHFYNTVFPRLFQESVIKVMPEPYDVLIIDEAQDILGVEYLEALDLVLEKGLRKGMWQIFLDRMQNIYNPDRIEEALQYLEEVGFARYKLSLNCRNTLEVAVITSVISGLDMALTGAISGGYQTSIHYSEGQFKRTIENLLDKLHEEGLNSNDIILLSTRVYEKSSYAGIKSLNGKSIVDISKDGPGKGYDFCTMQAFKGLERKLVIATDVFDYDIPEDVRRLLLYSGLSRAMTGLVLLVNEKQRDQHKDAMRAFGARLASIKL